MNWGATCTIWVVDTVFAVTDDMRIADTASDFGAEVVMVDPACDNGIVRVAVAVQTLGRAPELVIKVQGDAPLSPPWLVKALVGSMRTEPGIGLRTLGRDNPPHLCPGPCIL